MSVTRHIVLTLVALLCLTVTACGDNSCYENGSALPLAELHLGQAKQTVTGLTIMGIGAPGDSLLADSSAMNEVYLPLRASVSSTSYSISRWVSIYGERSQVSDTLTLDYKPIEYFHSIECGTMFNFDIKNVTCTHHGIDSVVLLTPTITNSPTPSLRIHFTDFSQ